MSTTIVKTPRVTTHTLHYDQYSQIPDALWFGRYRSLSYLAVCLYGQLTQRLKLAYESGWYNKAGELFIRVKRSAMAYYLHATLPTLRKAYAQLEELDLIDIDKKGQHEIDEIYIKLPIKEKLSEEERTLSDLTINEEK